MKQHAILFLVGLTLVSCGLGVDSHVEVPHINVPLLVSPREVVPIVGSGIYVSPANDVRATEIVYRDEEVETQFRREVGEDVSRAIADGLNQLGYEVLDTGLTLVEVDLNRWDVISDKKTFYYDVDARAELRVRVKDLDDNVVYAGKYLGVAQSKEVVFSGDDIKKILESSINYAVEQILTDKKLLETLKNT